MKPITAFILVGLSGCRGETISITRPAYLYASSDDCHYSLNAGPDETSNRSPRGIVTTLAAGARVELLGEDIGKDALCYRVAYEAVRGYVIASSHTVRSRPDH
jgi:hypothetical protein